MQALLEHAGEHRPLVGPEGRQGRQQPGYAVEGGRAEAGIEQAEGGAARLPHRPLPAGQGEGPQPGEAGERGRSPGLFEPQALAAPEGAIAAMAGSVPGHAHGRRGQAVLGHAGQQVGLVVLHLQQWHPSRRR